MKTINIGIIGCGAAAVTLIRCLIEEAVLHNFYQFTLTIFELSSDLGVGFAYQRDLRNLILNRPINTSAAHHALLDEFYRWVMERPQFSKFIIVDPQQNDDLSYISREIFGYYIKDIFEETLKKYNAFGVKVNIIQKAVIAIHSMNPFAIEVKDKDIFFVDRIVLCTGNTKPVDVYSLQNTPRYINIPYPLEQQIKCIHKKQHVGIIGNSLTAVDIALSLSHLGHSGKITMFSRHYVNPRVRSTAKSYILQFLTLTSLERIKHQKGHLTLRDALRLFRKELKNSGSNDHWKKLFIEDDKQKNLIQILEEEIDASKEQRIWQSILSATNQIIEEYWDAFDQESKSIFMKKFHRIWLNNRSPIPLTNAKLLLEMAEKQFLSSMHGLKEIYYVPERQKYIANHAKGEPVEVDWIINATGPSKYIERDNLLLYGLIEKGFAKENSFGGLDVDFNTSYLLNHEGKVMDTINALGHNTTGVYYYTSSLEMIAKKSKKIAQQMMTSMIQDNKNG